MRKTKFSLIVTHQPSGYAYTCGFKNNADAELFVAEFGGDDYDESDCDDDG